MISKHIKRLQLNEKDNFTTAAAKGMLAGVIDSAIVLSGISLLVLGLGTMDVKSVEIQEAEEE